jgi:hypothetical protein
MSKKSEDDAPKRGRGRPSLYKPEYCEVVVELGRAGKSMVQMAAQLGVDRASILRWRDEHEEFRASLSRALVLAQEWWEDRGQMGLHDRNFNAALWMKIVASRYREDYADRKEITGADGGPLKVQASVLDVAALDAEDIEALEAALRKAVEKANGG